MTMMDNAVRTYAVGDRVSVGDYALFSRNDEDWCRASVGHGYICSIAPGHTGPQHVAATTFGEVVAVDDRDTSGDPVEGTFEPGDMVQALPGLPVATVLSVGRDADDGVIRAWLVGQRDDTDTWRLMKSPVDGLTPHTGSHIGPSLADVGAALRDKAATMDADVERNRELRRIAERELQEAQDQLHIATTASRDAQAELARTREELATVRNERWQLQQTHDEFRQTVVDKAMELARAHDWCSVVQQGLEDMGLGDLLTRKFRVSVTVTATRPVSVEVEAREGSDAWRLVDNMSASELANLIDAQDSAYRFYGSDEWEHESHDSSTSVYEV